MKYRRGGYRKKRGGDLSHISSVLSGPSSSFDISTHMEDWLVRGAWQRAVGEKIAERSEAARLDKGVLRVTVSSASWSTELRFLKDEIMEKMNAELGREAVTDIVFKTGAVKAGAAKRREGKKEGREMSRELSRELSEEEMREIEETVAAVKDRSLRETIKKAMAADKRSIERKD